MGGKFGFRKGTLVILLYKLFAEGRCLRSSGSNCDGQRIDGADPAWADAGV